MDLASLSVKVTTNGVQQAATDLDKLATSGDKAAKSTDNLNKSFNQAGGIDKPAKAAAQAFNQETAALAKLAGQIDPTIAKFDKLDALQTQLGKFKKSGMISADDFTALNATLDASRAKIGGASDAVHKFSLNNSLARRELGYLAKDLATGNYGRFQQSALTLANASGVMQLAFTGMGAAVLGAVATVALFAVGAAKGAAESEELRKSVIATGGAAGITGAAFRSISQDIGGATGSYSDAAKAIAVFANSTKVAGVDVQTLGTAAVNMATVTGLSAEKASEAILSLSKDPANAVAELNEKYNFLTSAQYAYIRALEDSGQSERASAVAQGIAAQAFADRAKDVDDGAGIIIRAAHAVGRAWDSAWDSIKGVGATKGLGDQVKDVQAKIASLTGGAFLPNGNFQQGADNNDPRVKALQAQLAELRRQQVAAGFKATDDAQTALANQQAIAAQKRLSQFNPPDVTLINTIKKAGADRLAALYGVVDPAQRKLIEAQFTKQVRDANDAYQSAITKGVKKPKAAGADPFASLNGLVQKAQVFDQGVGGDKANNQQVTAILAIVDAGAKLIESGKSVAQVQALVEKGVSALNEGYAKQAKIVDERNVTALKAYQSAIDQQIAARQQEIDLQVAAIGMGAKEALQLQETARIRSRVASTIEQLNRQRAQKGADTKFIDAEIEAQKASIPVLVKQEDDKWKAIAAAQSNGLNGMQTAAKNFLEDQKNTAAQMEALTTQFIGGFGDAFAQFVSGAESAKKAFGSLIDSMYQSALKFVANKAIQGLLDSFSSTGGGSASSTPGSTAGGWGSIFSNIVNAFASSKSAKGNVFTSTGLSQYSGQVVSKPTMFAFAHGAGLMGEAGPEAILPLRRTPAGKLGIEVSGGSSGAGPRGAVSVNQTIVVQGTINRRTAAQIAQQSAREQRIAQTRNA